LNDGKDASFMIEPVSTLSLSLADPLPDHGRHSGFVRIPHATDRSAYGFVPLPIAVVGGRPGPTVLLMSALYGDEHDSQIAVATIMRQLDPAEMTGRVIALTMANAPAALAGKRISPIDGLNLNRSFPGDILGPPTSIIANYIERQLMTVSDIVLDLHSDSRSFRYTPCATVIYHDDAEIRARRYAAARAFGAPTTLVFHSFEDRGTSGAARRAGAVRIATEIGGDTPVATTVAGVRRLLTWAGILPGQPEAVTESRLQIVHQERDFIYTVDSGMFQPAVGLDQQVAAGELAGEIVDIARPFAPPIEIVAPSAGTLVCTRGAGLAQAGDCLMHLATSASTDMAEEFKAAANVQWLPTQGVRTSRRSPAGARAPARATAKSRAKR
jgi:predicted deacylase